jgi:general stress protein 26
MRWLELCSDGSGWCDVSAMPEASVIDRVWKIIETVGVCMLTTCFNARVRARPLEARPDRKSDRILFITDLHSAKCDEVERWPDVGLVFIGAADKAYLSITAKARIVDDLGLRKAAWRKNDEVWWPGGPNDPNVCVLVCDLASAELWDGPSIGAVAAYEFAKARATGTEPDLGENRKITVNMKR